MQRTNETGSMKLCNTKLHVFGHNFCCIIKLTVYCEQAKREWDTLHHSTNYICIYNYVYVNATLYCMHVYLGIFIDFTVLVMYTYIYIYVYVTARLYPAGPIVSRLADY